MASEDDNAYETLEIEEGANDEQISKAYRRLAVKYHPDKNPDNPAAAEMFRKILIARDLLLDAKARGALDALLKSKRATAERMATMNAQQRKAREELDARERAKRQRTEDRDAQSMLQAQLKKLREESMARLEAETEKLRSEMRAQSQSGGGNTEDAGTHVLEVSWAPDGSVYDSETLHSLFLKYGPNDVLVSRRKPGRALVSFTSLDAARRAQLYERGTKESPLLSVDLRSTFGIGAPDSPKPSSDGRGSPHVPMSSFSSVSSSSSSRHAGSFAASSPSAERQRESDILARMRQRGRGVGHAAGMEAAGRASTEPVAP